MNAAIPERSIAQRVVDVLRDRRPEVVKADVLCALAGVRRVLLGVSMAPLIAAGQVHMVDADMYGYGPEPGKTPKATNNSPPASVALVAESIHSDQSAKNCRKCAALKPLDQFNKSPSYPDGRDITCKQCRKAAKDAHDAERAARTAARNTPVASPSLALVRTPVSTGEKPAAIAVEPEKPKAKPPTLEIPPRPGMKCWFDASVNVACIQQGDNQIDIPRDHVAEIIGWLSEVFGIDLQKATE